jgi:hypothetical protein
MEMKDYKKEMRMKETEIKRLFLNSMAYNGVNLYKLSKVEIVACELGFLCIKKYANNMESIIDNIRYSKDLYESLKHIDILEELGIKIECQLEEKHEKTFWGGIKENSRSIIKRWFIDCSKIKEIPKVYQVVRNGKVLATFSRKYTAELYLSDYFLNCEDGCAKEELEVIEHEIKESLF